MKRSNRLVLLVGVFLAVVAFVLIAILLGGGGNAGNNGNTAPTTTNIVVAARDIPLGSTITADDVTTREILVTARPADALTDPAQAIGQIVRSSVTEGQLVTEATWTSGSGSIADIEVPAGKVAMAVKVDQVSGVGTVIKPGDYVDAVVAFAIAARTVDDEGNPILPDPGTTSTTSVKALLQGMQVLGTLLPPVEATQNTDGTVGDAETAFNDQQQIVILAVSLQQAEVLKFAQHDGLGDGVGGPVTPNGITLVLRSLADFTDENGNPIVPADTVTTGVVLRTLLEDYGVLIPDVLEAESPAP